MAPHIKKILVGNNSQEDNRFLLRELPHICRHNETCVILEIGRSMHKTM